MYFQVLGTRAGRGQSRLPLPRDGDRRQASSCSATTCCAATRARRVLDIALQSGSPQPVLVQVGETLDKRNALANGIIKG